MKHAKRGKTLVWLVWLAAVAGVGPGPLQAQVTETLVSLAHANYSGYVLDSDVNAVPSAGRHQLHMASTVTSKNLDAVPHQTSYYLSYRLVDAAGQVHPLFDSSGVINADYSYNLTNNLALAGGGTVNTVTHAYLRPAARLRADTLYKVELKLFKN